MWTNLNFKGSSKTKKRAGDISKRTLDKGFERDWSVGLGAMLGEVTQRIKKYIFIVSGIFPGKAYSVKFLCFECTVNPQNLMKIVWALFEKIENFIFYLCELRLILRVDRKRKNGLEIFARGPNMSNVNGIDQLV